MKDNRKRTNLSWTQKSQQLLFLWLAGIRVVLHHEALYCTKCSSTESPWTARTPQCGTEGHWLPHVRPWTLACRVYAWSPESALLPWQPGPQHVEVSCIHLFAATQLLSTAQGQHRMWNEIGFSKYTGLADWQAGVVGTERFRDEEETDSLEYDWRNWKARHFLFLKNHVRLTVWAEAFNWKGRSGSIQEVSCLVLGSAKVFASDYKDLFSPNSMAETRAPAQGRKAGWPWRECCHLSRSKWWLDWFIYLALFPWGLWWLWSYHHCLKLSSFPLPHSLSQKNGFKMISYKVL